MVIQICVVIVISCASDAVGITCSNVLPANVRYSQCNGSVTFAAEKDVVYGSAFQYVSSDPQSCMNKCLQVADCVATSSLGSVSNLEWMQTHMSHQFAPKPLPNSRKVDSAFIGRLFPVGHPRRFCKWFTDLCVLLKVMCTTCQMLEDRN